MDSRIYKTFFANFTESLTTHHFNLPCHNLICLEKLNEVSKNYYLENDDDEKAKPLRSFPFSQSFQYETDSCIVLYPGWSKIDKAYDYVFKKLLWNQKLAHYVPKNYKKGMRKLSTTKLLKSYNIDRKIFRYLNILKCDPAEEFVGDYNWLYTGGNIVGFKYYDDYWVITPDECKESTFLNFIQLNSSFIPIWKNNIMPRKHHLIENQPVYQITCKTNSGSIFFAVRQKEWITMKKLSDNCEINDIWSWSTHESRPHKTFLTASDLSQDSRYLSIINNDCHMIVYNIECGTPIFSNSEPCHMMPWSRVLFGNDAKVIYFADQHSFKIFDMRADLQPRFIYHPAAVTNKCEKICNFFGSEMREYIIYIATSHNAIEVDIRNGKNIQRWTHMMKYAAQFGATSQGEEKELIILQSEDSRELVGIHNEGLNDNFPYSKSNPYLFHTLQREVKNAHFNGFGFHHKIGERLDFKITGLHVARDGKGVNNIFTVNGGGDVVMTKLKNRKLDDTEGRRDYKITSNSALGLQNLDKHCYYLQTEKGESKSSQSAVYNVSPLITALKNPDRRTLRQRKRRKPIYYYWPSCEMYSPKSLQHSTGFLAEKILPVWGINSKSYGDKDMDEEEQKKANAFENSHAKVTDWIQYGRI